LQERIVCGFLDKCNLGRFSVVNREACYLMHTINYGGDTMKELKKIDGWRLKWLMIAAVIFVAYFTYVCSKYGFYNVIDSQEIIYKTLKAYVISVVTIYFIWDIYNYLFSGKEDYGNLRSN